MSGGRGYVAHVVAVGGVKAACVKLGNASWDTEQAYWEGVLGALDTMADDEDVSDAPTAPFPSGPMHWGAWYAEPVREDGWMWDALVGRGAGGAA